MDELERSYEAKLTEYNALVAGHDPTKVSKIQSLNGELASLLHTMIGRLTEVKSNAANITAYRDILVNQLVGIQNDASIMQIQRDQYITLEMLQTTDQVKFNTSFFWYAIALCIAVVLFLIVLMWKGGQKTPTMPTMMSSPNTMDAFT
jgi:hypothetical protein